MRTIQIQRVRRKLDGDLCFLKKTKKKQTEFIPRAFLRKARVNIEHNGRNSRKTGILSKVQISDNTNILHFSASCRRLLCCENVLNLNVLHLFFNSHDTMIFFSFLVIAKRIEPRLNTFPLNKTKTQKLCKFMGKKWKLIASASNRLIF